jgi:hypothetical protein
MDNRYYYNQLETQADLAAQSSDKQAAFFQHILLVSSSILGILISLHTNTSAILYIRLVYVLSVASLALGVLTTGIVVYDHSRMLEDLRRKHNRESIDALKDDRKLNPVYATKKKRTSFCEKYSLFLLVIGLFLLTIYAILAAIIAAPDCLSML